MKKSKGAKKKSERLEDDDVDETISFLYSQMNKLLEQNTKQLLIAKKKLDNSVPLERYRIVADELNVFFFF
jgi:hypothetical protein